MKTPYDMMKEKGQDQPKIEVQEVATEKTVVNKDQQGNNKQAELRQDSEEEKTKLEN